MIPDKRQPRRELSQGDIEFLDRFFIEGGYKRFAFDDNRRTLTPIDTRAGLVILERTDEGKKRLHLYPNDQWDLAPFSVTVSPDGGYVDAECSGLAFVALTAEPKPAPLKEQTIVAMLDVATKPFT